MKKQYWESYEHIYELVADAIDDSDDLIIKTVVNELDEAQLLHLLSISIKDIRMRIVNAIDLSKLANIFADMMPDIKLEILSKKGAEFIAHLMLFLDKNLIVDALSGIDEANLQTIKSVLPKEICSFIDDLLAYPENSAGRIVRRDTLIVVPVFWSISQVTRYLKHIKKQADYHIFVVDNEMRIVGTLSLHSVISSESNVLVSEIMNDSYIAIGIEDSEEDIIKMFRRYAVPAIPVVNKHNRIFGLISFMDVTDSIIREVESDLMHISMASSETSINTPIFKALIQRLPWLCVNLLASTMSSYIVGIFSSTIAGAVELAIIMPTIASMSGNTGLQALTVTVRAVSVEQITKRNFLHMISKEAAIGFFSGAAIAIIGWILLQFRFGKTGLSWLFALSIILCCSAASMLGSMVPIILNAAKTDPAISSSVIVCAATDSISFYLFLTLAQLIFL